MSWLIRGGQDSHAASWSPLQNLPWREDRTRRAANTLGGAWAAFEAQFSDLVDEGAKSDNSLRSYRHAIEGILGSWENATLRELSDGTAMVAKRHREITAKHGKASAMDLRVAMSALGPAPDLP